MTETRDMRLADTVAFVTGASGGIGQAICKSLSEAGAKVIATDLSNNRTAIAADIWLDLDVTDEAAWTQAANEVRNRFGHLDILVNNAGIDIIEKMEDISFQSWRKTQSVNADSVFLGVSKMLPLLREAGHRRRGGASVINFSSIAGLGGIEFNTAYCASKGAVRLLTKALAVEFGVLGYKIRINSVHPGGVETGMLHSIFQSYVDLGVSPSVEDCITNWGKAHPIGRMAEPDELAAVVRFLASDEASFVHGSELVADGGFSSR